MIPALICVLLFQPTSVFAQDGVTVNLQGSEQTRADDTAILDEVLDYLSENNIEGIDRDTFIQNAIYGMVYSLDDPYSDYYDPEQFQQLLDLLSLDYVGVGIQMQYTGGELYVVKVAPGSAADQAGMEPGDVISQINGKTVAGLEDASHNLSGKAGDTVLLSVKRGDAKFSLRITLAAFDFPAVESAMFSPSIGYIALNSFTEDADDLFAAALDQLKKNGMKSFILDLRDNPGGYLDTAQNIAKLFMDQGVMIYTEDNSGTPVPITISDGTKLNMPVYILTNENTASASEALTGALRDNGLAVTIGTQTFGKGRIQNLIPLSNGGDLKLTTMKFMTPNHEDFNHIGLKPMVEVKNSTAQLITALKMAGLDKITISGDNHTLTVNGNPIAGNTGLLLEGKEVYVSARVLNALVGGDISWQSANKKVVIKSASGKLAGFTVSSGSAVTLNGENYLRLADFQSKFPELKSSYKDKQLTLWTN